jgi:hypothetical protein
MYGWLGDVRGPRAKPAPQNRGSAAGEGTTAHQVDGSDAALLRESDELLAQHAVGRILQQVLAIGHRRQLWWQKALITPRQRNYNPKHVHV